MRVEVFPCNDGLEARLSISDFQAAQWNGSYGDAARLAEFLAGQGLARELVDEAALGSICGMLKNPGGDWTAIGYTVKEAQAFPVSCGIPPVHEEAEGLLFHKSYVSEAPTIAALREAIAKEGLEASKRAVDPACLVEAGHEILSFESIIPGKPGKDVFGRSIPYHTYDKSLPRAGSGIQKSGNKWVAREPGILVLDGNVLKVLGAKGGSGIHVTVSPNKMFAHLSLDRETMDDYELEKAIDAIPALFREMGLLVPASIDDLVTALFNGRQQEVLALQGIPPQAGADGKLEFLIDPEPELPSAETVAKMDFKSFSFFKAISKGDKLARIIHPDPGVPGRDVYGKIIIPEGGKPFQAVLGTNTEYDPKDPFLILASCNGRLNVVGSMPAVVDTLKIDDVSFKTGNVKFPGSVEIEGNVLDSFAIDAQGDVGIGGVVENGNVVSEGAIVIKGGVVGGGRGLIKSKLSSVTIGYIRNQRIESHSNIIVYNEVFNGQLLARKSILMKSTSHSVIGGHLVAFDAIEIHNSGNDAGTKTILEVGKDFEIEAELIRKQDQFKIVRVDHEFLEKKKEQLELIVRWEKGQKPENKLLEQRVKGVLKVLERLKTVLSAEINALESRLYHPGECCIAIRGTVHPGTLLRYKSKTMAITEETTNKRWIFKP